MGLKIELSADSHEELDQLIAGFHREVERTKQPYQPPSITQMSARELIDMVNEALSEQGLKAIIVDKAFELGAVEAPVEKIKRTRAKKAEPAPLVEVSEADTKSNDDVLARTKAAMAAETSKEEAPVTVANDPLDPAENYAMAIEALTSMFNTKDGRKPVLELRTRWGADRFSDIDKEKGTELLSEARELAESLGMTETLFGVAA